MKLLDSTGGFSWKLLNPLRSLELIGGTNSLIGDPLTPDSIIKWTKCVPVQECWTLAFDNENIYSLSAYLDGTEIISEIISDAQEEIEICIGREGSHCKDPGGKFKYRRPNKKDKRIGCKGVADEKGRKRKKICDSGCVGDVCRKVKQRCLESCGKVGRGECDFLKDYGLNPPTSPPLTTVQLVGEVIND